MCRSKQAGGLCVKSVYKRNVATLGQLVWDLVSQKGTLCVIWVNINKLKRLRILGITKQIDYIWRWTQILNIRPCIQQFIDYKLGNGQKSPFWFDPWVQGQSLKCRFPEVNISNSEVSKYAVVSDV